MLKTNNDCICFIEVLKKENILYLDTSERKSMRLNILYDKNE